MPVHPAIAEFLATLPPDDHAIPDVTAWRAAGQDQVLPLAQRTPVATVRDVRLVTAAGQVRLRIYLPGDGAPPGVVVYLHGGAFFSGSLETHDEVARKLAARSGLAVVAVGYRLAPEHAFPAGLDDCYAALSWACRGGPVADLVGGWDTADDTTDDGASAWGTSVVALAGDSSGGNFVASLTGRVRDAGEDGLTHQILLYPSVDLNLDFTETWARYPSLLENARGFGLETAGLRPHNSFYLASGADPTDPRVSPILRADLTGLPPAFVATAEYDPLRDEGEAYAGRLRDAGVEVQLKRYAGATHGFVQFWGGLPEYDVVFDDMMRFLLS